MSPSCNRKHGSINSVLKNRREKNFILILLLSYLNKATVGFEHCIIDLLQLMKWIGYTVALSRHPR